MKICCLDKQTISKLVLLNDIIILIIPKHISWPAKNTHISTVLLCSINNLENVYIYSTDHPDFEIICNNETNDIIDLLKPLIENKNCLKWIWNYKKIKQLFDSNKIISNNCVDINSLAITGKTKIIANEDIFTPAHFHIINKSNKLFSNSNCIPLSKFIEEFSNLLIKSSDIIKELTEIEKKRILVYNKKFIEPLSYIESGGVYIDKDKFKTFFPNYSLEIKNNLIYGEYNLYTKTGRPTNSFGGVNFLSLNKYNGMREFIISRFGSNGFLLSVDYSAFHPTIISHLMDYKIEGNIYHHLREDFLNKFNVSMNIDEVKKTVFKQLYGKLEKQYEQIDFFKKISELKIFLWNQYNKNGYLFTPILERKITFDSCDNPELLLSYYLQAIEGEVALHNFSECMYLFDDFIVPILYIYDSFLFDVNVEYKKLSDLIYEISGGFYYPIKLEYGINYGNMKEVFV